MAQAIYTKASDVRGNNVYRRLHEVATKYYPKENGYCGVITTAVITGQSFGNARNALAKLGRQEGHGTSVAYIKAVIKQHGFKLIAIPESTASAKTMISAQRCLEKITKKPENADRVFVVWTTTHIAAFKYGQLQDWSNTQFGNAWRGKVHKMFEVVAVEPTDSSVYRWL